MLFNSYEFIVLFLPITLTVYFALNTKRLTLAANSWLLFASLFFYSWWNVKYLPLLLGSILFNYTIGNLLTDYESLRKKPVSKKSVFIAGIGCNLLLLGYFKYTDFFIANFNRASGAALPLQHIILPLGISFFTITQIAYLVDSFEGLVEERNLLDYAQFVTFFPHLLAGPILHHKEMMPQFSRLRNKLINYRNLFSGLTLFSVGLFKKVVIADQFAQWARAGFDVARSLKLVDGWMASLSYTFQLYFDFSGYSDMAIGVGLMFNILLPINFQSPYKAVNIIDFWQRWHITLSNFITTYLYTPIVRSFSAIIFRYSMVAIFLAMLISGFWHGAGWGFVIWGALHGGALVLNHVWKKRKYRMPKWVGWFITFNFVNLSFVFFRAKTLQDAFKVLKGMSGANGTMLHYSIGRHPLFSKLGGIGITFGDWLGGVNGKDKTYLMVLGAMLVTTLAINSNQIIARAKPDWRGLLFLCVVSFWAIMEIGHVSEFLYFQF
jgi:D-alanyl-lipoteichoic acid acyltransferase DltB (MBOAT superfamily)